MKIVIAGLLPGQCQHIAHDFPGLDIRFANKESKTGAASAALFQSADRIFVMKQFVSHALTDKLDRAKTTLIDGGMTSLRNAIENVKFTAIAQKQPKPPIANTMELAMKQAKEHSIDSTWLKTAAVGEYRDIPRPPKQTPAAFKQRLAVIRSHYKRTHGRRSTVKIMDGVARITVTEILQSGDAKPVESKVAKPVTAKVTTQLPAECGDFWQQVFLRAISVNNVTDAARVADESVELYKQRFNAALDN